MSNWPYIWLSGSSWPDVVLLLTTRCLCLLNWVIDNYRENICKFIFFLSCLMYNFVVAITQLHSNMCLMYHFVVVAATQLHSNSNNEKIMYINCSIFNNLYLDWCFYCHCCCCYCVILLLFICHYRWTTTSDQDMSACHLPPQVSSWKLHMKCIQIDLFVFHVIVVTV